MFWWKSWRSSFDTKRRFSGTSVPSPVTQIQLVGKTVYIKRDDQLNIHFPGNKIRKLFSTIKLLQYVPSHFFFQFLFSFPLFSHFCFLLLSFYLFSLFHLSFFDSLTEILLFNTKRLSLVEGTNQTICWLLQI